MHGVCLFFFYEFRNLTGRVLVDETCCNLRHISYVLPLTCTLEYSYHAAGKPVLVSMILIHDTWNMSHVL
jgi:hypothetical protein